MLTIQTQIEESRAKLEPFKEKPEFEKLNDLLKEIDKVQKNVKVTKQYKFKKDLDDWAKGKIFDPTHRGGRSRSRQRRSGSNKRPSCSGSEDDDSCSVSFLDQEDFGFEDPPSKS